MFPESASVPILLCGLKLAQALLGWRSHDNCRFGCAGKRRGLWRGTTPTVVRLSLGAGLHFCFLDSLRGMLERRHPDGRMTSMDAFLAGGLSRAGSAIIMCPITVIKTRMEYGGPSGQHYKARRRPPAVTWCMHWRPNVAVHIWRVRQGCELAAEH